jgi:hypothetical protein
VEIFRRASARVVNRPVDVLDLDGGVEGFGGGVVQRGADRTIDCSTPSLRQAVSYVSLVYSVVAVKQRPVEAAPSSLSGGEGVDDRVGAHVAGDHPPGQPARVQIDHRGQIQDIAFADRQVSIPRGSGVKRRSDQVS